MSDDKFLVNKDFTDVVIKIVVRDITDLQKHHCGTCKCHKNIFDCDVENYYVKIPRFIVDDKFELDYDDEDYEVDEVDDLQTFIRKFKYEYLPNLNYSGESREYRIEEVSFCKNSKEYYPCEVEELIRSYKL